MTQSASYQRTRPSPTALTIVILLHTAAIGALAMSKIEFDSIQRKPTSVFDVKEIKEPPEVPPEPIKEQPQHQTDFDIPRQIVSILEPVDSYPPPPPLPPMPTPEPVKQIVLPPAPPPVSPKVEPARARAHLASYVSDQDYPASAVRNEEQGTTRFRLQVNSEGRVDQCTVIVSSGSAALDAATCQIMKKRAKFAPARNSYGQATTDIVTAGIKWMLPDE
jgi:protein TonB